MPAPPSHVPELLAPAGTVEAGLAAFDAGADAIYLGLPRFNARERGENCTLDQVGGLITVAADMGKRVYVTLNTLLRQQELPLVAEMLAELTLLRPHALIVQDLGLVRLARDFAPELELHASTQMGIHNSAGVEAARRMGLRRVILERQVTFEEIAAIRAETDMELEVFVHGALCCGRSGKCLFSSWMGGWSGNRGKCKQPCRRRYFSDNGNGFFFSPGDLYSLDELPRLRELGVSSLKIEGRMRRPDYVHRVVSAYRLGLDASRQEFLKARGQARETLAGAMGRKWVSAFQNEASFDEVVHHRTLGASGQLCGEVARATPRGIEVVLKRPLAIGDVIRVQPRSGDEGDAITVNNLSVKQRPTQRAKGGERCWIPGVTKGERGALVFKTASAAPPAATRPLPPPQTRVDLCVTFADGTVRVRLPAWDLEWSHPAPLEPARTAGMPPEKVATEFRRSRSKSLGANRVNVTLPENVFLPASHLKALRRDFWSWLTDQLTPERVQQQSRELLGRMWVALTADVTPANAPIEATTCLGPTSKRQSGIRSRPLEERTVDTQEVVLPEFCPEGDLGAVRAELRRALKSGVSRVRVTSLYGLELLHDVTDLHITASFSIPVCNAWAADELADLGADRSMVWVELDADSVEHLRKQCRQPLEWYTYGRLPLLSTRFTIPAEGHITDARGGGFRLTRRQGLTWVTSDTVFAAPAPKGMATFTDLRDASPNEPTTSRFNLDREFL